MSTVDPAQKTSICKLVVIDEVTNGIVETFSRDGGESILISVNDGLPFKVPVSLIAHILQSCDPEDVVGMVGEDLIISSISLDGIFRVFSLSEILSVFDVDVIDQDFIDNYNMDTEIFDDLLIYELAASKDLFQNWANNEDLRTWDDFWESLEIDEVISNFGVNNILNDIDVSDVVSYYGLDDILDSANINDVIDTIGDDNILDEFSAETITEHFEHDDLLDHISMESVVEYFGGDELVKHIGLEEIADNESIAILSFLTAGDIADSCSEEKLKEALRIKRELT